VPASISSLATNLRQKSAPHDDPKLLERTVPRKLQTICSVGSDLDGRLQWAPRLCCGQQLVFPSGAASPKYLVKESTTKSPPRDIRAPCRRGRQVRTSLPPKRSCARTKNLANSGKESDSVKRHFLHHNIRDLVAGWGARIRTWEWRIRIAFACCACKTREPNA
jgi:hypothetical protein